MQTDLRQATSDFCLVLAELLQTRRVVGKTGRVYEGLAALSTLNRLHTIHDVMLETGPSRTLEVGLSFGGSALVFCESTKNSGGRRSTPRSIHFQATNIGFIYRAARWCVQLTAFRRVGSVERA